jgi:hypothetical protein
VKSGHIANKQRINPKKTPVIGAWPAIFYWRQPTYTTPAEPHKKKSSPPVFRRSTRRGRWSTRHEQKTTLSLRARPAIFYWRQPTYKRQGTHHKNSPPGREGCPCDSLGGVGQQTTRPRCLSRCISGRGVANGRGVSTQHEQKPQANKQENYAPTFPTLPITLASHPSTPATLQTWCRCEAQKRTIAKVATNRLRAETT